MKKHWQRLMQRHYPNWRLDPTFWFPMACITAAGALVLGVAYQLPHGTAPVGQVAVAMAGVGVICAVGFTRAAVLASR